MSVNLTIFFIYLQKYVIKNTQFSKQNRRKQFLKDLHNLKVIQLG
jgi:hypothetical protein